MTDFQKGDVIWASCGPYSRVGVLKSAPYSTFPYALLEDGWWFYPRDLTLIGGPRMEFLPGDIVDISEDAKAGIAARLPSAAAGKRETVESLLCGEEAFYITTTGCVPGEYLTLVKRDGYIDLTDRIPTSTLGQRVEEYTEKEEPMEVVSDSEDFRQHASGETETLGTWSAVGDDDSLIYVVEGGPAYRVWIDKL